jgi:hypothetical protein
MHGSRSSVAKLVDPDRPAFVASLKLLDSVPSNVRVVFSFVFVFLSGLLFSVKPKAFTRNRDHEKHEK